MRPGRGRLAAFLLALCLLLCACGTPQEENLQTGPAQQTESPEPVLVARELKAEDCEPERSVKTFQDIASFLGIRLDVWQETYRELQMADVESAAVAQYVQLLTDEFDYEIVGASNFDTASADPFNGTGPWEVLLGLTTVDTGRETRGRIDSSVACDIRLHCDAKGKMTVVFADLFHTEDYGFRWSGSEENRFNELYGQHALDAYYLKNGRYASGSDGVLSVEAGTHGEAMILLNGKEVLYSTDAGVYAESYADYACDDYVIKIRDFMDGVEKEYIEITVPKSLMGGEVYTLSDALAWMGDSPISIAAAFDDSGYALSYGIPKPRNATNACTLRVLQWDDRECVVYLSMDLVYELEPMTVEVLAAVPAYGSLWEESFQENEAVTLKVGESMELKYSGSYVFMPNYETYEWKIASGQGAAITGYGDSCTVTAVSPGQITVKCVYSYGKDEPDVLTGIPRNENHTKSKLYYINVVE